MVPTGDREWGVGGGGEALWEEEGGDEVRIKWQGQRDMSMVGRVMRGGKSHAPAGAWVPTKGTYPYCYATAHNCQASKGQGIMWCTSGF